MIRTVSVIAIIIQWWGPLMVEWDAAVMETESDAARWNNKTMRSSMVTAIIVSFCGGVG